MPANEAIPYYENANRLTGQCSAPVVGKTFVVVSGNEQADGRLTVATAGAGAAALGVAAYDQVTSSDVPIICGNQVVPVTAGAAIAAGDLISSDGTGRAVPATPPTLGGGPSYVPGTAILGKAMTAQGTVGQPAKIKLNL